MNFFARFKKLFLILGFLILIAALGYLIWRFFFQSAVIQPTASTTPGVIGTLPSAGPGGNSGVDQNGSGGLPDNSGQTSSPTGDGAAPDINQPNSIAVGGLTATTVVNQNPSLDPTLSSNGGVQFYDKNEGKFYRLDSSGQKTLLSDKVFHSVDSVTWAPDKNKAVLTYPDGSKILYDFNTQKQVTLPSHWEDFSFSPDSSQLITKSLALDPENRWLVVSNDDGSQAKAIEKVGNYDKTMYPSWSPNNQIVAMYTEGLDFNRQTVYFVGLNGENFPSTIVEGRGFESQWSSAGNHLLYSVYNSADNLNPRLWVVDATSNTIGENRHSIDLQTWASKCTFASDTEVYCAVPDSLEKGSGLFPELADKTQDSLYKIDLTTGTKKLIAIPDGSYNISQIVVNNNQSNLYFMDKFSGSIYEVKLK